MKDKFLKFILAARPVHWSKNLIIFIPSIMAHQLSPIIENYAGLKIFLAMSFFASAGYLFNDFCDKEDDKLNAYKKSRAYASGDLNKKQLFALALAFFVFAMILSLSLSWYVTMFLLFYLSLSILYSALLKKFFILDILLISFFFLFRLFIGHEVFVVPYSPWLLAFAFFLFFGLASIKRVAELQNAKGAEDQRVSSRRAYTLSDLPLIMMFGVASGFMAILVLALYINSPAALKLYAHAEALWFLCPVFLYWLYRLWLLSYRGAIRQDPMSFTLTDLPSYACLLLLGTILFCSI